MASDGWHHIEGVLTPESVLQLYVYDNFTKPLSSEKVRARAFAREGEREVEIASLKPSSTAGLLQARVRIGEMSTIGVVVKVRFTPDSAEQRFDFAFRDPRGDSRPPTARGTKQVTSPIVPTGNPTVAQTNGTSTPQDIASALPNSVADLNAVLTVRLGDVRTLIDEGNYAVVYVPTMLIKEVALALGDRAGQLPVDRRDRAALAVKHVVAAAWQLDQFADFGDRDKLLQVYRTFANAVAEVQALYALPSL